jgi:DNA-binding response OmpR family regulator
VYGRTEEIAMRVLLVEDERDLANAIARGLRRDGLAVDIAFDGAEALEKAAVHPYDVVVLDRDLPAVHGDEVCRELVAGESECRILMLTAAAAVHDRIDGLDLGADDYLAKPFDFGELRARLRALGRRARPAVQPVLERGGVRLEAARRIASREGRTLELTRKEFAVLQVLLEAEGAVVSAEELLDRAWDEHTDPFTNVVRVTIMKLRKSLGEPPLIETVRGVGYRIP